MTGLVALEPDWLPGVAVPFWAGTVGGWVESVSGFELDGRTGLLSVAGSLPLSAGVAEPIVLGGVTGPAGVSGGVVGKPSLGPPGGTGVVGVPTGFGVPVGTLPPPTGEGLPTGCGVRRGGLGAGLTAVG